MEIALTGFNPSFDSSATAQAARQRQQQDAQQQSAASRANSRGAQDSRDQQQTRAETTTRSPETARIINGEVLSSETARVYTAEPGGSLLSRSSQNQQSPNSQPDTRRVSMQQALQTFTENESLITEQNNPRQVSGIIDEFV